MYLEMVVDLGRRVGRQLSVVSDDLNKIGEMRKLEGIIVLQTKMILLS